MTQPASPRRLCADIGGSFIKFAAVDEAGALRDERRVATATGDWPAFAASLAELCGAAPASVPLCLSIAGVADPESGIATVANIPCVSGRRLGTELSAALGRPVRVANDADCFVLAEAQRGAAQGARIVFGIILGSGVGGGLVVDGRIVEGAGGVSGEWGHGPVMGRRLVGTRALEPFACGCGQAGCLDAVGSARGLERLDAFLNGAPRTSLAIVDAWNEGERGAGEAVELYLDLVSGPLAMVVNLTGASAVPVAGGLSNSERLVAALDAAVRARILRRTAEPLVVRSVLGADAGLIGASLL